MNLKRKKLKEQKNEIIESTSIFIDNLINEVDTLKLKIDDLESGKAIVELRKEIESIKKNSLHIISDYEKEKIKDFKYSHNNTCNGYDVDIILSHTNIGVVVKVECHKCNTIKDVTDYNLW